MMIPALKTVINISWIVIATALMLTLLASCTSFDRAGDTVADSVIQPMQAGMVATYFYIINGHWPEDESELFQFVAASTSTSTFLTNMFSSIRFIPDCSGNAFMVYSFAPPLTGGGTNFLAIGEQDALNNAFESIGTTAPLSHRCRSD